MSTEANSGVSGADGFKVRVDRDPLTMDQLYAMARPEFQQALVELLRAMPGGELATDRATLKIQSAAAGSADAPDTLNLERSGGGSMQLQRGVLIDLLREHAEEIKREVAMIKDDASLNKSALGGMIQQYEEILDIVMAEEDRIRAEVNVPTILNAYAESKARVRNWMIAFGSALAVAIGSAAALNNYAGEKVGHDLAAWTDSVGDGIHGVQKDVEHWFKHLGDDGNKSQKKRRKDRKQ